MDYSKGTGLLCQKCAIPISVALLPITFICFVSTDRVVVTGGLWSEFTSMLISPALSGASMERRTAVARQIILESKRRSETDEAAFDSSHRDAPNQCLTFRDQCHVSG